MTVVVEDGSLVAGANSYVSLADADTYFTTYGHTLWTDTATDEAKERALLLAAQYMQQKWRLKWRGSRIEAFQSLDWPRTGVPVVDFFDPFEKNVFVPPAFENTTFIPTNVIPVEVQQCQMLLASASVSDDGASAVSLQTTLGRVTKREKLATMEVEYMPSDQGGSSRLTTVYWDAMQLIEPFIRPSSRNSGGLVRA